MNPAPQLTTNQLEQLAHQYGTPVYIYHADRIRHQFQRLQKAFQETPARFFYACKSLTNLHVLRVVHRMGASLDCVSIHEVQLGLMAGFQSQQILFTPNCVDMDEMHAAVALGVHINIDNLSILEQFGHHYGDRYPIFIRLNPHIMAGGNYKISTGHIDSKFGISIHQLRHIQRIVKSTGLLVEGIHMHTGSEIKDIQVFLEGLDVMLETASVFPSIKYIDLGSGFKVAYQPSEAETDIEALGVQVAERMRTYTQETGHTPELWFEPGKYLVSQAGYFVVKTNVIKQTPAAKFVGVNSGFNHLVRPMMYDAYHHIENLSNPTGPERIYTVVGNICETDTFAWDRTLREVHEGDFLVFFNAGAYGFEMSSNFNSRLKPAEVLVDGDQHQLIRRRDEFADLLRNQIPLDI